MEFVFPKWQDISKNETHSEFPNTPFGLVMPGGYKGKTWNKKKITVLCPWHDGVFPQIGPPLRLRQRIIFFQFSVADCVEVLYHVSILYTWEQFCAVIWKKIWKQWWALAMWQLAIASINQSIIQLKELYFTICHLAFYTFRTKLVV